MQADPVVIEPVYDAEGIVKYLCKSPWHDAKGESLEEKVESVIRISDQIRAITRLRRYASFGSLSIHL